MNCNLKSQTCGYLSNGLCGYDKTCAHQSDFVKVDAAVSLPPEDDAKRIAIRSSVQRMFDDAGVFHDSKETKCPTHGTPTIDAGFGVWPCPECQRAARNGIKPRHVSLPYKDAEEPPEITTEPPEISETDLPF